ncbi:unnamed protein product [Schistosoma margrebowiei]|uniref:Uncharacterized protein n=1 Tax=Schistosoma margrebowiei TaxID=48269 RepID=A0A183LHI5_9TREM|nr:unnamed protein product [Schistosoma margrebowiei]
MVVGGSEQETVYRGFVLLATRQHGVHVILRELIIPDGFDPVSLRFTDKDVIELSGPRLTSCRPKMYLQLIGNWVIVNGVLIQYNLHLTRTNCRKHNRITQNVKNNQAIRCQLNYKTIGQVCRIQILLQPWMKQQCQITIKSCKPEMKSMNKKKYTPQHHQSMIPYNHPLSIMNNRVLF